MDFGEPDADVFPRRERTRFRDSFGHALLELRSREQAFKALEKGPWALFIAIAVHWQMHAEAWPSQETLARFSGWSSRAVRTHADVLAQGGFVKLRRERQRSGAERIFYAPGPATLVALTTFAERFPRAPRNDERPSGTDLVGSPPSEAVSDTPPEVASARPPETMSAAEGVPETASVTPPELPSDGPPEAVAEEHRDHRNKPSSCELEPTEAHSPAEEEQVMEDDRELARLALAERMRRKFPDRAPGRWFASDEIDLVAVCAHAVGGTRENKLQALRDGIDGAFATSKRGAPSVAFTWGTLEHFLDHVERGKRRRIRAQLEAHAPRRGVVRDPEDARKARAFGLALVQAQLDAWNGKPSKSTQPHPDVLEDLGTQTINATNITTATAASTRRIT